MFISSLRSNADSILGSLDGLEVDVAPGPSAVPEPVGGESVAPARSPPGLMELDAALGLTDAATMGPRGSARTAAVAPVTNVRAPPSSTSRNVGPSDGATRPAVWVVDHVVLFFGLTPLTVMFMFL